MKTYLIKNGSFYFADNGMLSLNVNNAKIYLEHEALEIVSKNDYLELIDYNGLITSDDVRHRIDLKTSETRQKEILERVCWALFFIIITLLASLLLKIG